MYSKRISLFLLVLCCSFNLSLLADTPSHLRATRQVLWADDTLAINLQMYDDGYKEYAVLLQPFLYGETKDTLTDPITFTMHSPDTTIRIPHRGLYDVYVRGKSDKILTPNRLPDHTYSDLQHFQCGWASQNLSMTLVVNAASVYYRIKVNNVYNSNVEVAHVVITDTTGVAQMVSTAQQLETIDVSSLARGAYLFNVYLSDGKRLVKNLLKR